MKVFEVPISNFWTTQKSLQQGMIVMKWIEGKNVRLGWSAAVR